MSVVNSSTKYKIFIRHRRPTVFLPGDTLFIFSIMALMNGFLQVGLLQLCNLLAKIVKSGADGVNGAGSGFFAVPHVRPVKDFGVTFIER